MTLRAVSWLPFPSFCSVKRSTFGVEAIPGPTDTTRGSLVSMV